MSLIPEKGYVYLVGAGPGALDLVTLRARELIGLADVLVYDFLCNAEMLRWGRPDAEIVYAGKSGSAHTLSQDEINALLINRAEAGRKVVRLKGGDPYVFGRGGEEAQVLRRAGIPFEVVPGVTSAIAAPAYAGIPVTHRDLASTVTFVTGHENPTKEGSTIDWNHLAKLRGTKIFLMGVERLRDITMRLMAEGAGPMTPVALIRWGTTFRQESLEGTLASIADLVEQRGFSAPAITVIGEVVKLRSELNWFEELPLFGKRIVVTRTRRQASGLTSGLARLGADVMEIPTIRVEEVKLSETHRAKFANFSHHFDWLIFTSPTSVGHFFDQFFQDRADLRALGPVKIGAIGPATAREISKLHLHIDLQPEIYAAKEFAKTFVAANIAHLRFCLPQGNLADTSLAEQLRGLGATVDEWLIYRTVPENEDVAGARVRYLREGAHFITFTSSSTVENWHRLGLQPAVGQPRPRAISLGPITSGTLRKLGYEVAAEASASTIDRLIATITSLV